METLLFREYKSRIPIHLYNDSEGTLELIDSTKQVNRKCLRMVIQNLKVTLMDGEVTSYQ